MISRKRRAGESSRSPLAQKPPTRQKQNTDKVYFVQNENQVLKLRNYEIETQLVHLATEHKDQLVKLQMADEDCLKLQEQVQMERVSPQIVLASHQRKLKDQIQLLEADYLVWQRKIRDIQQAILQQENTMPVLLSKKEEAEVDLWKVKMQSEGMKVVVTKMEKQIEQLRLANQQLSKTRKNYGPEQQKLSKEIEQQLRGLKEKEGIRRNSLRKISAAALFKNLDKLYKRFMASASLNMRMGVATNVMFRKILFAALQTSQNYVTYIKKKAMSKFRDLLTPAAEHYRLEALLIGNRTLRSKAQIFSKWRKQFIKAQYSLVRKLEVLNSIHKVQQAYQKTVLYNSFLELKHRRKNLDEPLQVLCRLAGKFRVRALSTGWQAISRYCEGQHLDHEIEASSKTQTEFLVKNLYFSNWATYVRQQRPSRKYLLHKCFRAFKKIKNNKRKRQLQNVIGIINQKNNINDKLVRAFSALKYGTTKQAMESTSQKYKQLKDQTNKLNYKLNNFSNVQAAQFKELALVKVGKVLLMAERRALHRWRRWNYCRTRFLHVLEILHRKSFNDLNWGFAKIQTRRFKKLKISIADKIQSCEFSYNYLTQQNAHIKEVLDRKTLQVQKTKFIKILKNIMNNEKTAKRKYFEKFMQRGNKVWKIKQVVRRMEHLVVEKVKKVFMYELRKRMNQQRKLAKQEHSCDLILERTFRRLGRYAIIGFKEQVERVKRLRRVLAFVSQRNLQLKYHCAYMLIKKIFFENKQKQQYASLQGDVIKLKTTNEQIDVTEQRIAYLSERLKQRNASMKNRVVASCKIFFTKSIKNYVGHYINRWRDKLIKEKRVLRFADTLELKFRTKFVKEAFRTFVFGHYKSLNDELNDKLSRFSQQMDGMTDDFNKYSSEVDAKIAAMKAESVTNAELAANYKKRYAQFNVIRVRTFKRNFGKMYLRGAIFKKWKAYIEKERGVLDRYLKRVAMLGRRLYFPEIISEMRDIAYLSRIKQTIHRCLRDSYWYNTSYFLMVWRSQAQHSGQTKKKAEITQARQIHRSAQKRMNDRIESYQAEASRIPLNQRLRKIFSALASIARKKKAVNQKGKKYTIEWANKQCHEFMAILRNCTKRKVKQTRKLNTFLQKKGRKWCRAFLHAAWRDRRRRYIFQHNFLGQYVSHWTHTYATDFFANIKLYGRAKQLYLLDKYNDRIQRLVEVVDKKFRLAMVQALRKFRKNQFIRDMEINLMKRLTRKAMNKRIELCFFQWKLEAEARNVVHYHASEGQTRKRQREFRRTKRYIEELKRKKGLLLQNDQGNLVLSPRFLQRKEQQQKIQNLKRYKLVSRLLMFANGEHSLIKAWNSVHLYSVMRMQVKKAASLTLNYLRNPEVYKSFRRWRKMLRDEKENMESMSRAELIKLLQRQKDKLEVEYSKKISNEEIMNREIRQYEILERQGDKKERLCACLLIRYAKNKKKDAFKRWREVVQVDNDQENNDLEVKADQRLAELEREIQMFQLQYEEQVIITQQLKQTALEGLQIAEAVRKLTIQRDELNRQFMEKALTCQALLQQNVMLNNRFNQAHEEAFQLLSLTKN